MPGSVEAGNKMIVNVGTVKMIGQPRSRQSVLTAVANKGSSSVTVEPGLDWVAGDKIGFAPTATQWTHYESAVIASYDIATGAITLTAPLQYYHFGAAASTGTNYQGLDMRGEVVLLTRNIKIRGDVTPTNDWHGHMLTMDSFQFDMNGNQINYYGKTTLKDVAFEKMGQLNNFKAAIRFENSMTSADDPLKSSVENCVISDSVGWGISILNSQNISLKNVNVFNVSQIGVSIDGATNVIADGVNVYGVRRRQITFSDNVVDKECCFAFGTYYDIGVTKSSVINSRVSGCPYAGFLAPGYSCSDPVGASTTNVFKNNVAHSVDGSGAAIVKDRKVSSHTTCY